MKAQWTAEKEAIQKIQAKKAELEKLRTEAEQATRRGDLQKAAEISYGTVPQIEKEIQALEKRLAEIQKKGKYLKEEVDAEDIAEIVSKWTGIPVTKMLESEKARLLKLEEELGRRVIGQREALAAVSNAVRRARAGLQDPNRPTGLVHLPRSDGCRQNRDRARRSPSFCSTTSARSCGSTCRSTWRSTRSRG